MAGSKLYYVGNISTLGRIMNSKIGNASVSSSYTTDNLVSDNYYAYLDGYTSNHEGSQQGTGLGYQIKVIVRFGQPDLEKRTIALGVGVYFCRKDYVGSNNTLTVSMIANNVETKYSNLISMSTEWKPTTIRAVTLNYDDNGNASTTVKVTGSNNTGSCSSITCTFIVKAPKIAAKPKASNLTLSTNRLTLGSTNVDFTHDQLDGILTDIIADIMDTDGKTVKKSISVKTSISDLKVSWVPPLSLATNLTSVSSAVGRIRCVTYKKEGSVKGTKVGTKSYPVTFIVPKTAKIGIKSLTISDTTGNGKGTKGYQIGISKPKATLVLNTDSASGSTIEKVVFNFGNSTQTIPKEEISGNTITCISEEAISSSRPTITATVTDSRNMITAKSLTLDTYTTTLKPQVTVINVGRGTGTTVSGWTDNESGENCRLKYTVVSKKIQEDIAAGKTGSKINVKIQYKMIDADDFTDLTYTTPDNTNGTVSDDIVITLNDADNAYVIRVTATDTSNNATIYRDANLSTAFSLMEISSTGRGISIGCAATGDNANRFTVGMETKFTGKVYNSTGSAALTSDERKKTDIQPLSSIVDDDLLVDLFKLDPIAFKYKDVKDDVNHFGFSANKLYDTMKDHGIDMNDYSILEEVQETDPTTNIVNHFLTLRYEEMTPIMFLMIKNILVELININNRLKEIEKYGKKGDNEQ